MEIKGSININGERFVVDSKQELDSFIKIYQEEIDNLEYLEKNRPEKILTKDKIDKLENYLQGELSYDNGWFFVCKQKEFASDIEQILGIKCYE